MGIENLRFKPAYNVRLSSSRRRYLSPASARPLHLPDSSAPSFARPTALHRGMSWPPRCISLLPPPVPILTHSPCPSPVSPAFFSASARCSLSALPSLRSRSSSTTRSSTRRSRLETLACSDPRCSSRWASRPTFVCSVGVSVWRGRRWSSTSPFHSVPVLDLSLLSFLLRHPSGAGRRQDEFR